ncbi:endospore germination permease [Clostridiaceae bacterium 35-E11]
MTVHRNNDQISSAQLAAILSVTIIGIGILTLPRTLTEAVGPDGWIVVVAGSFSSLLIGLLIVSLVKRFPKQTIVEFSADLVGKPIGTMLSVGFCVYFIIFSAIEARVFGEIAKMYLLFRTPIEVLIISLLLTAAYLVRSGIEPIARMAQIIFPIAILTALIVILPVLPDIDWSNLMPVFKTPIVKLLKAIPIAFFSFAGLEIILLFGAYVIDPKKMPNSIYLTIGLVAATYIFVTMVVVARFGLVESTHIIWPTLEIFKTIDIPGAFIENIQIYVISIWILSVFMTLVAFYFGASLTLSRILKSKEQNYFVLPLLLIIYFIALVPDNLGQVTDYMELFSNYGGTLYILVIPIVFWGISTFKKKQGGKKGA